MMPDRAWIAREYGVEAMRASALLNFGFAGALPFLLGRKPEFMAGLPYFALGFCLAATGWLLLLRWFRRKTEAEILKSATPKGLIPIRTLGRLTVLCLLLSLASFACGCFIVGAALLA
jgi:hypothetical protein